jgi:hypothetical protein
MAEHQSVAAFSPVSFTSGASRIARDAMGKLNVKNGTPVGNEHLCKSCSWGQFTTGYRESEVLVFCTNTNPNFKVLFPVHECSEYYDKHRPDWKLMEKLAIEIQPLRVSNKTKGFSIVDPLRPDKPEYEPAVAEDDEEEDESVVAIAQ